MRRLKLYEAHKADTKMESDLEDMLVELKDMGMSVRVQSPDALGYSFIIIKQEYIPELDNVETYSDQKDKFLNKETNFNSLIEIDKPIFQSIFQMVMDYIMDRNNPTLIKIIYQEPFSQTVVKDVQGRFVNDEFLGIDVSDPYEVLEKVISGKKLEKLEIYFRELYYT